MRFTAIVFLLALIPFENCLLTSLSRRSFLPCLRSQRQLVEFCAGLAPGRVVSPKDREEAITVRRLNEMNHLVNDHEFEEILRLRHELRVEADVSRLMIAAPPLGFHPLQEIPGHLHVQLWLPILDE